MRSQLALSSLALLLAFAGQASAQTAKGFALNRFDPAERGSEWFAQDTLDLRGRGRLAVGATADFGYKPLVIVEADGSERAAIVRSQLFAHVGASYVLLDRLRLGLQVPIALSQSGAFGTVAGVTYTPADKAAAGDVRVGADARLLGAYRSPFTLAAGVQAFLPSGAREQYTGDGSVRVTPRLLAAGELGVFAWAARVGFLYRSLNESFAGSSVGTEVTFGASAGARVMQGKLLLGLESFGSTVVVDGRSFEKAATPVEALLGAHYTHGDLRFGLGVGRGLTRGFGTPQLRGLFTLEWAPAYAEAKAAPLDRDGDGIEDARDACPAEKGPASKDASKNGCPADRDGDGIYDANDACVDLKGLKSDEPKKNGCPPDKDGDGIYDADDACVDLKGIQSDEPKKNGCPPDRDEDGIYDADDACVDVKGVKSDDPKKNGCPPDKDGDGIVDPADACPDAAGPKNDDPKKNGCPAAAIVEGQIVILQQVKFKTASAVILKESDEILEAVAKILREHPEIKKVRVEGHTDNRGNKVVNKNLSAQRAASVVIWLTTKGKIDKKRLVFAGFGQDKPIDTNETEAGRQNNRRVEFHLETGAGTK
jgi:OOP family OmpA-OmpF porin